MTVQFYSTVYNISENIDYDWVFGEGSNSSEQKPQHTYTNSVTHSAILTVSNTTVRAVDSIQVNVIEKYLK